MELTRIDTLQIGVKLLSRPKNPIRTKAQYSMEFSRAVLEAFETFETDSSLFALPLTLSDNVIQPLPPVTYPAKSQHTFQRALNQLEAVLDPLNALYLILRRNDFLVAITYAPYQANADIKKLLIDNRSNLIQRLGEQRFSTSIICKEIGEITDARSWNERDGEGSSWNDKVCEEGAACEIGNGDDSDKTNIKDLGFKKNQCRLCDRRMKNKIDDAALEALDHLYNAGACSLNIATEILTLNASLKSRLPSQVSSSLPTDRPSFTFYRHLSNEKLYFIFCSPDCASVRDRMMHTMAIPGLINVIARDSGIEVDRKIEIHDSGDLEFEEAGGRVGRFRSLYVGGGVVGTESR
ncbi:hypothetical protein CC80DRAFT_542991 [Byssothecium circinans]|uniref:ADF-H domain-containing protein n=1 Tax=Byssothecium circinans TaxID=147558 RepID=A0A6A5U8Y4_9PLEO|nr:hypothetical protein CC80DRAFT_542991 [Byssothecium circinans]